MKAYLESFFSEFAYEPEDAEVLLGAYDRIMADKKAAALWREALGLYEQDAFCDYQKIIALADEAAGLLGLNEYTLELLVFICMTPGLERRYAEQGLDRQIYHNSILDLRYKLEECKAVYGVVGSFVPGWFAGFFKLKRFALGRLQFETVDFDGTYEKDGNRLEPGSKVINIHIPRTGTPMDPASCDEAFRLAKAFYKDRVGDPTPFVCGSWLLYPENEKILSEQSNTYKFMKRFDIIRSHITKDGGNLWRLFDTKETNPYRLPTDTSFRRRYAEHLKKGGKLGSGYGVFFL